MKLQTKLKHFVSLIFPSTVAEWLVFLFFLAVYGLLAGTIALNYRIVFDNRIPWDAYFSFDNRSVVLTGGGFERHPLSNYFFEVLRNIAFFFSDGKRDVNFRLVLALASAFTVSLNIVQIFKYLKNIIRLPLVVSLLILSFFGVFSTNILLSFTPETYTYTLFLLVLFNYYAALKLRNEQKIPAAALALSAVTLGGLTITNIVKAYIPLLFEKNVFRDLKKFGNMALRVLISAGCFVLLYLYRIDFNYLKIFEKTGEQYEKFSKPKVTPLWDMISSWFFGGNILFPSFVMRDYHNKKGFEYKALFMDVYSSEISYILIGMVLSLVIWSYARNFRNKFVQILMISFLFDVIIHCVLKFGLHTSYIYGGHFVFVYPLMIGWLFFSYRDSPKVLSSMMAILTVIFVYTAMNNIIRMEEFFTFLDTYYR
ncbi:DUF6080 domain-containing protein [Chryseobacterium sp.]|uniref:DUF6080 domain-containing protein n=1 Tax=Chryseobacterium sp. TaxID=1871047 RepID=UPI0011C6F377|nr:DUF6080 domain-containing protein [Chryseobacterium sp.]TXF75835.1 hypothetical protein FUA25_07985 [Chryseobacterium sp.]